MKKTRNGVDINVKQSHVSIWFWFKGGGFRTYARHADYNTPSDIERFYNRARKLRDMFEASQLEILKNNAKEIEYETV